MIVKCPYCYQKMQVRTSQLLFRGRLSVACPKCRHAVYQALRKELQVLQWLMVAVACVIGAWCGRLNIPGGTAVRLLLVIAVIAVTLVLGELCSQWISRERILMEKTRRMLERQHQEERTAKKGKKAKR